MQMRQNCGRTCYSEKNLQFLRNGLDGLILQDFHNQPFMFSLLGLRRILSKIEPFTTRWVVCWWKWTVSEYGSKTCWFLHYILLVKKLFTKDVCDISLHTVRLKANWKLSITTGLPDILQDIIHTWLTFRLVVLTILFHIYCAHTQGREFFAPVCVPHLKASSGLSLSIVNLIYCLTSGGIEAKTGFIQNEKKIGRWGPWLSSNLHLQY